MYFFIRTNNPRPNFHIDMSAEERSTMEKHVSYWSEKAERGIALVFGPVLDPKGFYGIGIYNVPDETSMKNLIDNDPAKGLLKYEILPMARAVVGKLTSQS